MYKLLQKYSKKLLAVFAVLLMIVFILPNTMNGTGSGENTVVARIGEDEEIRARDFRIAEEEWKILQQLTFLDPGAGIPIPLIYRLGNAAVQIQEDPQMFLLLQKEALQMGVTVTNDQVQDLLTNQVNSPLPQDNQRRQFVEQAVAHLLLIESAYHRAASTIKISQPLQRHAIAHGMQQITADLVEFSTDSFKQDVPAPTAEQLQEHFQKYADVLAAAADPKTNPFGFGYRYPNRVKLQYIMIPQDQVRKMVEASRSDYEWEVEARKFYQQNQGLFAATQPATQSASDAFSLGPELTRPATGPTTRPFAEARDEIKQRLIGPQVTRRMNEIQSRISSMLTNDYLTYSAAAAKTDGPTTMPASSLGVPYNTPEYMQKLAETIQRELELLPTVANLQEKFRTVEDLKALEQISSATTPDGQAFPSYASERGEAFVPEENREQPGVLSQYEASLPLTDARNNVYFFRLTEMDPAHAPRELAEVEEKVRQDVIATQAFERTRQEAEKFMAAARERGLASAAEQANRKVITAGPFRNTPGVPIPNYQVTGPSQRQFIDQAFELLTDAATQPSGKPMRLIELPQADRVLVAQLRDVHAIWEPGQFAMVQFSALQSLRNELEQQFQLHWFDYEQVQSRLNYKPLGTTADETETPPAAPPRRPLL